MKNRILTFITGILVGAIIATIGFNIYIKSIVPDMNKMPEMMNQEGQGMGPQRPFANGDMNQVPPIR